MKPMPKPLQKLTLKKMIQNKGIPYDLFDLDSINSKNHLDENYNMLKGHWKKSYLWVKKSWLLLKSSHKYAHTQKPIKRFSPVSLK